jgi:ThiF family
VKQSVYVIFPQDLFTKLHAHLFPGDGDEHAAVIAAGCVSVGGTIRLLAKELHIAVDGLDHVPSNRGYRAITSNFIHPIITHCRDQRLVYLSVHNHLSDTQVDFSVDDLRSHERGYPALLDIAEGMPVGALVFGLRSMQLDLWMPDGSRLEATEGRVLGPSLMRLFPRPSANASMQNSQQYSRQLLMFGEDGQALLGDATIGIVGLGGVGSLLGQTLAYLGVKKLILADFDELDSTNRSRVIGSTEADLNVSGGTLKTEIALRTLKGIDRHIQIQAIDGDYATDKVAKAFVGCDFIFLAADSMRSRLVFNATVHQYFIPGFQLGNRIRMREHTIEAAIGVARFLRPGYGCLMCNGLIDPQQLAQEVITPEERDDHQYGSTVPNPSVITLNSVVAAHATNEFLFWFLGLRERNDISGYAQFDHLAGTFDRGNPRRSADCTECANHAGSRFAMGDAVPLPTLAETC